MSERLTFGRVSPKSASLRLAISSPCLLSLPAIAANTDAASPSVCDPSRSANWVYRLCASTSISIARSSASISVSLEKSIFVDIGPPCTLSALPLGRLPLTYHPTAAEVKVAYVGAQRNRLPGNAQRDA